MTIIQAIGRMEGFGVAGSRSTRNNNPGDLDFEPWMAKQFGAVLETIPTDINETPRFARFPSADRGWAALRTLLTNDYLGMTIAAAFNKYAPPDENDTNLYTDFVCKQTGLQPEDVLTAEDIG
jgi:hypothetical protein